MAKEFADAVGIRLQVTRMDPEQVVRGFADICLWRDDPTADLSGSSYYAVMHAARQAGVQKQQSTTGSSGRRSAQCHAQLIELTHPGDQSSMQIAVGLLSPVANVLSGQFGL